MTKLKELRKSKGISPIDFCYHIRLHPVTLCSVENRRLVINLATRSRICDYFGLDTDKLFDENGLAI